MKPQTLRTVLQLTRLKADQSAVSAQQARSRLEEARSFSDQVQAYAQEYDQGYTKVASVGDSAMLLQERSQFNANLRKTAREQKEQVKALEQKAGAAIAHAMELHAKAQAMERFVQARRQKMAELAQLREAKEAQDVLQARLGKSEGSL
jgi:flagellar biosynthesis chaperone FliJ